MFSAVPSQMFWLQKPPSFPIKPHAKQRFSTKPLRELLQFFHLLLRNIAPIAFAGLALNSEAPSSFAS